MPRCTSASGTSAWSQRRCRLSASTWTTSRTSGSRRTTPARASPAGPRSTARAGRQAAIAASALVDRLEDAVPGLLLLSREYPVRVQVREIRRLREDQRTAREVVEITLVRALRLGGVLLDDRLHPLHRRDVVDVLGEHGGDLRLVNEIHVDHRVERV